MNTHVPVRDTRFFGGMYVRADPPSREGCEPMVPEIIPALDWALEHPEGVSKVFLGYQRLCEILLGLQDQDLVIADAARAMFGSSGDQSSASHFTLREFLGVMTDKGREDLSVELSRPVNPEDDLYKSAMQDLMQRLARGHLLFGEGRVPVDGDPDSDSVIWGHTRVNNPTAMLHFLVCHFTERYVCQAFALGRVEVARDQVGAVQAMITGKDSVLNAMTETLLLWNAQCDQCGEFVDKRFDPMLPGILSMWRTPKSDGDLGWISDSEVQAFWYAAEESCA